MYYCNRLGSLSSRREGPDDQTKIAHDLHLGALSLSVVKSKNSQCNLRGIKTDIRIDWRTDTISVPIYLPVFLFITLRCPVIDESLVMILILS